MMHVDVCHDAAFLAHVDLRYVNRPLGCWLLHPHRMLSWRLRRIGFDLIYVHYNVVVIIHFYYFRYSCSHC